MSGYGEQPPGGYGGEHPSKGPYDPDPYGSGGPAHNPYGQDPGGQNPYAQDPYAPDPYGQNPYGQYTFGQEPYGQSGYAASPYDQSGYPAGPQGYAPAAPGYGPPGLNYAPVKTGSAIAALICNSLLCFTCYGVFAAPGIITAAIALSKAQGDPQTSRKLTLWSWGIFGASLLIAVLVIAGVIAYAYNNDSGSFDGIY